MLRNQLLKTQFNKDAMSSKAMWYILVLKLHIQCRADVSVFPLKSENISIAAEFLGRSLGTSAFVGFNSFNARCILGFFLKISTHILSCCSSPPTCWTNSVSLFYIYFQALQRFQTNHTDFLSLPEFSLCSYVQIHNKTKGNTSWKSFPILSIST